MAEGAQVTSVSRSGGPPAKAGLCMTFIMHGMLVGAGHMHYTDMEPLRSHIGLSGGSVLFSFRYGFLSCHWASSLLLTSPASLLMPLIYWMSVRTMIPCLP